MVLTLVNIRMDEKLKKSMKKTWHELEMTMTTAFCIFAKKVVMEQKIPFEISTDPFYSEVNMQRLDKALKDVEEGKVTRHNVLKE